jgi:hypothetical protein
MSKFEGTYGEDTMFELCPRRATILDIVRTMTDKFVGRFNFEGFYPAIHSGVVNLSGGCRVCRAMR